MNKEPIGTPITQRQATLAVLRMLQTPLVGDIEQDPNPGYTIKRIKGEKGCYEYLSTGEKRLVDIAVALWTEPSNEGACINVIGGLDRTLRRKVLVVLFYLYLGRDLNIEVDTVTFNDMFEKAM